MTLTDLGVTAKEQTVYLQGGYSAALRFDMIYKRWFCDLYHEGVLVYAGIPLTIDTAPLNGISPVSVCVVDLSYSKEEYEPFAELGSRLALMELAV